jgi:hypothetical protein
LVHLYLINSMKFIAWLQTKSEKNQTRDITFVCEWDS